MWTRTGEVIILKNIYPMALVKKTYKEKLLDPRWQRRRLEVLERDEFTCQYCESTTKTLHIHHFTYAKSGNPWDVDHSALITLCEDCHYVEELDLPPVVSDMLYVVLSCINKSENGVVEISGVFKRLIIETIIKNYPRPDYKKQNPG